MRRMTGGSMGSMFLAAMFIISSAGLPAQGQAQDAHGRQPGADIRLSRVVLYTAGVGYFEHEGTVEGTATIPVTVPDGDINDFLKSLVVQDLDGGTVRVARYPSREPLERSLALFGIDISDAENLADLLHRLRGEAVTLVGSETIRGSVVTVEEYSDGDPPQRIAKVTLLTAGGLRDVRLDEIREARIDDPKLRREIEEQLTLLAGSRNRETRTVQLTFAGTGLRRIRMGYIRAVPVWKNTYRLILGDVRSSIQGWAIVENTGAEDWSGVALSLVAGRPISFIMDLESSVYVDRPVVRPPVAEAVRPKTWEADLAAESAPSRSAARPQSAPSAPSAGFAAPPPPSMQKSFDPTQGVQAVASGGDMGTFFVYDIVAPIDVPRSQAGMVPVLVSDIEAERLLIYDQSVIAKHPMQGVRLTNGTGLHLAPGPVTLFADGSYAGEALVGEIPPGAERLLTYAVDVGVEVAVSTGAGPERLTSARIVRGTMIMERLVRREREYRFSRSGGEAAKILIEHPRDSAWKLTSPAEPASQTASSYRFSLEMPKGTRGASLRVTEEQVRSQSVTLRNLTPEQIFIYIEQREIDSRVRDALARLRELQIAYMEAQNARRTFETQLQRIVQDQQRIRQNMEVVSKDTDLYRRYLSNLSQQEDWIEQITRDIATAVAKEEAAKNQVERYLATLEI